MKNLVVAIIWLLNLTSSPVAQSISLSFSPFKFYQAFRGSKQEILPLGDGGYVISLRQDETTFALTRLDNQLKKVWQTDYSVEKHPQKAVAQSARFNTPVLEIHGGSIYVMRSKWIKKDDQILVLEFDLGTGLKKSEKVWPNFPEGGVRQCEHRDFDGWSHEAIGKSGMLKVKYYEGIKEIKTVDVPFKPIPKSWYVHDEVVKGDSKGNVYLSRVSWEKEFALYDLVDAHLDIQWFNPVDYTAQMCSLEFPNSSYTLSNSKSVSPEPGKLTIVQIGKKKKLSEQYVLQLINANFAKGGMEITHLDELTETLMIQINQARSASGLKKANQIDYHYPEQVFSMSDGSLVVILENTFTSGGNDNGPSKANTHELAIFRMHPGSGKTDWTQVVSKKQKSKFREDYYVPISFVSNLVKNKLDLVWYDDEKTTVKFLRLDLETGKPAMKKDLVKLESPGRLPLLKHLTTWQGDKVLIATNEAKGSLKLTQISLK